MKSGPENHADVALTSEQARGARLEAEVLLLGDPDRALRVLVTTLGCRNEGRPTIRPRDFSDRAGHPYFRPFSRLRAGQRLLTLFDVGAEGGGPANTTAVRELVSACTSASVLLASSAEITNARVSMLRLAKECGVPRVILVTNAKRGAADANERELMRSVGFADHDVRTVAGDLRAAAKCRCQTRDCARCLPWRSVIDELTRERRSNAGHALGALQAISYGMTPGSFVVETARSPADLVIGSRMNVLLPDRIVSADVEEVTPNGYVFTSREVNAKRVVGIASRERAVKVATEVEVEPVFGPLPQVATSGAEYVFEGTSWEISLEPRARTVLVRAGAAQSYDKSKRWLDPGSGRGSVPFLYEPGRIVAVEYSAADGERARMIGRVCG